MTEQPDRTHQVGTQGAGDAWTESSKYLAYVFVGVLVFGISWYLADEVVFKPGSKAYYGLSIACYVLAFFCVACGGWAFLCRQANHVLIQGDKLEISDVRPPLLRRGEEGWHNVFSAATYVTIAFAFHLIATNTSLRLPEFCVSIGKVVVLIFGVLATVHAAHAVAYFVSRSLSGSSDASQIDGDAGRKTIRKLGTAIMSILAALAALATIVDVFGPTP